jgi:hypothetical protein
VRRNADGSAVFAAVTVISNPNLERSPARGICRSKTSLNNVIRDMSIAADLSKRLGAWRRIVASIVLNGPKPRDEAICERFHWAFRQLDGCRYSCAAC